MLQFFCFLKISSLESVGWSIKILYSIFGFMKHVYASGMKVKLDIDMEFSFYSMHTDFTKGCLGPNIY